MSAQDELQCWSVIEVFSDNSINILWTLQGPDAQNAAQQKIDELQNENRNLKIVRHLGKMTRI